MILDTNRVENGYTARVIGDVVNNSKLYVFESLLGLEIWAGQQIREGFNEPEQPEFDFAERGSH